MRPIPPGKFRQLYFLLYRARARSRHLGFQQVEYNGYKFVVHPDTDVPAFVAHYKMRYEPRVLVDV